MLRCKQKLKILANGVLNSGLTRMVATSTQTSHDVIVLGTGAFGSSAAFHLSKQGARVLALDMHPPAHPWGSSHGLTRIIRLAYFEGPEYVPLLKRSYNLFLQLQQRVGQELFFKTGMLDVGATFERSLTSALEHHLEHEVLTADEVNRRFPGYSVPEGMMSLYQPDGGMLCPEKIIQAHRELAAEQGATLLSGDRVLGWRPLGSEAAASPGGVEVTMASGAKHTAGQLIVSAGAWMSQLVPETQSLCVPERQVVAWFDCPPDHFLKEQFPVFIAGRSLQEAFYGFPQYGQQKGFKIGLFGHLKEVVNPDSFDRGLSAADDEVLRQGVRTFFPSADGPMLHYSTCMFTNTPDGHFIIDRHPRHPQVILCSACSGHGFKMSSGIGELLADIVMHGGAGSHAIQQELRLHRVDAARPGHQAFIEACSRPT